MIIPQIILAGVVATLVAFPEWLSKIFITVSWGQQAVEQVLPEVDRMLADSRYSYSFSIAIVLLHGFLFLATAAYGIRFRKWAA